MASLEVAYINKGSDGYDYLEEIEDEKTLAAAMKVVKKVIENIK